jgi:small GTP-binding protein
MKIDSNYELSVAILFIGDSRVGKSNMIYRFIENKYSEELLASVGFDIKTKVMKICNKNILVKIFDTAGQERFNSITTSLFQKVQGIVLVYDISNEDSFRNINNWILKIKDNFLNVQYILVGNKCDLENERIISKKDGMNLAKKYNFKFFETSSKTGQNINEVIIELVTDIYKNFTKFNYEKNIFLNDNYDKISIQSNYQSSHKKCC